MDRDKLIDIVQGLRNKLNDLDSEIDSRYRGYNSEGTRLNHIAEFIDELENFVREMDDAIEAIEELYDENDELKERTKDLEKQVERLEENNE